MRKAVEQRVARKKNREKQARPQVCCDPIDKIERGTPQTDVL